MAQARGILKAEGEPEELGILCITCTDTINIDISIFGDVSIVYNAASWPLEVLHAGTVCYKHSIELGSGNGVTLIDGCSMQKVILNRRLHRLQVSRNLRDNPRFSSFVPGP